MRLRAILLLVAMCGCRTPEPPPIPVSLALDGPWAVVSQDDDEIALRFGTTGEGARVWLRSSQGHRAGVTPVQDGRTFEIHDGATVWPLVATALPEKVQRVEILVQGIDLVVRIYGPPLYTVSARDDAPADPLLTWVRLRPRPDDWRVVVDGLGTVSLPAPDAPIEPSPGEYTWSLHGLAGAVVLDTNAPAWTSSLTAARWAFDTMPSLEELQPYPRTGLTWTPAGAGR